MHWLSFGLALFGLMGSDAQIISNGQCSTTINPMANFNLESYMGLWYEIERTPHSFQSGDCTTARYSINEATGAVDVYNAEVAANFYSSINGTATLASNDGSGALIVDFPSVGPAATLSNYWILDTDYLNYALVYSCTNINDEQRSILIWKLGRSNSFLENMHVYLNILINNIDGVSSDDLVATDHSEDSCFLLPELEEGEPVVLSGQCDSNMPVVQNFDAERYLGLWHEVASYPSEFQDGTCPNSFYSLITGSTVVDVTNTQVVNLLLDTITGSATVSSNDGSGRLSVIFPDGQGGTVETEYLILGTDYDNYALVYSCVNLNEQQMRVWSWKLSRSKQLSTESANAINAITSGIIILNERYYETSNQTDDGCFYLPEPVPSQPVIFPGQCDLDIPAMADFDAGRYMGLWHDVESYPEAFQFGTCNNALYGLTEEGTVDVYNTQVVNERLDTINGTARVVSDDGSAKMVVTFTIPGTDVLTESDYWVLDTDYENYALVYSCRNINDEQRSVSSWKLSRTKEIAANFSAAINEVIETIPVLNQQYYERRDQSDEACFYFPYAEAGVPVIFPGQCDPNVVVVTNFDVERYSGLWHEVSSYPSVFQSGACNNALYTLTAGGIVEVFNTQVLDSFLDTINGTAVFATTDGSAKLIVSFPIPGTTEIAETPYWVLATDYDTYSLVYACVNLNPNQRAVWSWKLSRSKSLPVAANEPIDAGISAVQVLDAQYYQERDQSDEGCFYLPDLELGEPVIIVGQCDPNITVIQNFDPNQFSGLWHEIEAYPSDNQGGSCNNAEYTVNPDGSVNVYNTQVINQLLDTINGTARLATDDGSGKLLVELYIPETGQVVTSEIWILDTDYNSYALLYVCENINTESRRVWSWKVSRTRQLANDAISTINAIVDTIPVLHQQYYMTTDQSDDACFYYPEPTAQPVVFRGQCDETIPAVPNFNPVSFAGLWHEIEKYPQLFQDGTCANALYSLNEDGTVAVYNTQVENELLDTINGSARLISDDGSGKLLVTLPVPGTELTTDAELWVLATDYVNYAFLYSCLNIGPALRTVSSWKMSRTKQLTPEANDSINIVIDTIPVLDARYYDSTDQSDEGCFYYPEPVQDQPVVMRGQCDQSIPVVDNFDVERYSGLWHEIASYPSVFQDGSCNNARYTLTAGGIVEVYNTQVRDQSLDAIVGTAILADPNGGAKLTVSFPIAGTNETIESPYWVLATDYDSYALVYSCININDDERAVWSWKLSRTKYLPVAANEPINATISVVQVLDDQYYQVRDQSDEGCFYLPDLELGEPVIIVGQCDPNITVVQNFDVERYFGLWHEIEAYPSENQGGTCNNAQYTLNENGTVDVYNTQVINELLDSISGEVTFATEDQSGKLLVSLSIPGTGEVVQSELWILDTDYQSYSLLYSCVNIDEISRRVWSWKLSRTRTLTQDAVTAIDAVVDSVPVLNDRYYLLRDQSDGGCFYYPVPNGEPVVFRGQCNESIPAVANFDPVRYLGLWHDIEKYPQLFQDGTCANAFYSLNDDGTVAVYNTQVENELLDTINGSARLVSEDGSGKLLVSFPIPGTTFTTESPYWILATDYDNYALVYSCVNRNEDQRTVSSWKLSRTRQLTQDSINNINAVTNTIPVLDSQYFETTDQSDEGCFYYPEHVQDQPVVLPGQCDETIPVVGDFDAERYSGLWHEISSYPSLFQTGSCNNALYTLSPDGIVEVYNTQVQNQRLDTINGTAALVDGSGSAKLTVNFPIFGTNETTESPYWVLATDYDSYSLVYSCINMNDVQRAVWSWKLSRTKDLSAAAEEVIDAVIDSIQVLDEQYFQQRDQSDDACFYLPYLDIDEPVIFVGQCDLNIPTQANFDPVRYSGLWHDIESYASVFQDGTCNNALYTVNPQGTVDVFNTQVINERLNTISGVATLASDDGKLIVTFPSGPGTEQVVETDYWVLSTDYYNYSLVYSCVNLDAGRRQVWSWKLSRSRELTEEASAAIDSIVDTVNVLNDEYYIRTDQSDMGCFYFPEHVLGQPVIFPGQCNETIQVEQNFDVQRYTGFWYDVESYPQAFQVGGTCANALYTLNEEGTVDVYNTQVLNQQLNTINGVARLADESGDAKLIVNFPITGTDMNIDSDYWVLSTDYDNYALVYSCANVAPDRRSVSSWKLSRQPTLSVASDNAIREAMEAVQVLTDEYFEETGQTEADCFYYPDNNGGPVILEGQCEAGENISVVTNFNVVQYLGLWYEIARFPTEFQTGECARAQYSQNAQTGSVDVMNSIVYDELLQTVDGTAVLAADDDRGILTVTFPSESGVENSISYYVLDTDYQTFALVYSCRNIDADRKQVYSWKLSRSRQGLSEEANERIDAIVSERVDLFEGYYETTDQGDAACFFYPEFADLSSAIILPGPCNQTIQGKANFEPARYAGRWFEFARYPQEYESGDCARAEYAMNPSGVLDVVNSFVNDESLDTVAGTAVVSPDGSGVLTVTLFANGETLQTNYFVLETDYDNFALVYSCRNLDNGDRQVSSWKLSRDRVFNPQFNLFIDPLIQSTQGLLESYYTYTNQTDEACFYLPELDESMPVVFRGQCEDVEGVQNFDIPSYLGWWHEIKHFPSGFETGTCLSSQYQLVNGQYTSLNTSINGLEATVVSNSVVFSADGRLQKILDNGEVIDIWVLATDYETYSLLYSCQNIDDEHRKVWSAKYSKERELTDDAESIMAAIIESIPVLASHFYLEVNQSEDACFHYPALGPGESVILPGLCDEEIPVVPDFDVASYTGLWYQVERYHQPWEFGSCPTARYTLDEQSGVVRVVNRQIVGEEIIEIEGTAVLSSSDGSGRIMVTFPVEDTEETTSIELYILATDYTSYALVYTCSNINQFQRSVGSWKLSRERNLTTDAVADIYDVMSTRQELHQPYFIQSGQSEECPSAAPVLRAAVLVVTLLISLVHFIT